MVIALQFMLWICEVFEVRDGWGVVGSEERFEHSQMSSFKRLADVSASGSDVACFVRCD